MTVLVRGGSADAIADANNFLMSLQNSLECWSIARQLLTDSDAGVQLLSSQLFYNKTRVEWTSLSASNQLELRDFLVSVLYAQQLCEAALNKIAQTLAFVAIGLVLSSWQTAFEDILTLFPKVTTMEILSSITLSLKDTSEMATSERISAIFLSHQSRILDFLEQCLHELPVLKAADLLMDVASCGFQLLRHSISALLMQGITTLTLPAIDVLIVATAKSYGSSEVRRQLQAGDVTSHTDLLSLYNPQELHTLRQIGTALSAVSALYPRLPVEARKKLSELTCVFCYENVFLLVQNEAYANGIWTLLLSATQDDEAEVACLAIGYWSDVKAEALKGLSLRTEFGTLLEPAKRCGELIAAKCCFPSVDAYQSTDPERNAVYKLRKCAEDSLYSLLCIFSEANRAQLFLEAFTPLLESQNPLHLELFLFVMRSMGLELESDKNRAYIGNLLSHFMKQQHPMVTRATLLFISEVSSTIKKIPGLLQQTLAFANEQIVTEIANGACGVTPVAVECLFNLMFYSEFQLQEHGVSVLKTAVMVLSRDYAGDVDRVLDLIWLLLNTLPREDATAFAPEVVAATLTGADQIPALSLPSVHLLLKRCYHLIRLMTSEAWIKAIVRSALSPLCQVCIAAVATRNASLLSDVGDLAYILFKRFGPEETDLHVVLFPALMPVTHHRSIISAFRTGMETATRTAQSVRFVSSECSGWYRSALAFSGTVLSEGAWQDWLTHFYGIAQILLNAQVAFIGESLDHLIQLLAATFQQALDQHLSRVVISLCRSIVDGPLNAYVGPHVCLLVGAMITGLGRIHMTSLMPLLNFLLRIRAVNAEGFRDGVAAGLLASQFRVLTSEDRDAVIRTFCEIEESTSFILKEMLFELRNRAEGSSQGKSLASIAKKAGSSTPKSRKELVLIEC